MFFNKKDDNFELKTEEGTYKYDEFDDDFFQYDEEDFDDTIITEQKQKNKEPKKEIDLSFDDTDIVEEKTTNTYVYKEPKKEAINNTFIYEEPKKEVTNTYVYEEPKQEEINNYVYKSTDTKEINNYIYEDEENEEKEESTKKKFNFNIPNNIIYILNKIFKVLLIITIVIAFMIIFDLFILTRFEKGPIFALKTKTYDDGGTKVYHGLGYKVIKYNVLDGRNDIVVGNYSITYQPEAKKTSLLDLAINIRKDYNKTYNELESEYVNITGEIDKINKKNKQITLIYKDQDNKYNVVLVCSMDKNYDGYTSLNVGDKVSIAGILYIDKVDDQIELSIDKGVVK